MPRKTPPSPEYRAWSQMKNRCYNPNSNRYRTYGARGIRVCEQWRQSFHQFSSDMGPRPPLYTLDRIDNDGHYVPGNCRWATRLEQASHKTNSTIIEIDGRRQHLAAWCREFGIRPPTVCVRLRKGWDIKSALMTPSISPKISGRWSTHKPPFPFPPLPNP